jgi:phosphatidylserine/phosphatidylglycerophosphate/cardiolipin synthase-like enzyme
MTASRRLLDHWLPPDGAGRALACLTTSFTFDPDFFETACLARFLQLDSQRGDNDPLEILIEEEERLAETRVTVVVDRSDRPGNRNLRWDLLPVGVRGGLLHAKVTLLVWEELVRFIVGSANLTPAGYRSQVELAIVLDADRSSRVPTRLFNDLLSALGGLVGRAPGSDDEPGPKRRAMETLELAARHLDSFDLPAATPAGGMRLAVATAAPGRPALPAIRNVWQGGPPRRATVLSPFFDTNEHPSPAVTALCAELAQRGPVEATFVLPVDQLAGRTVVRAPKAILQSLPRGVTARIRAFLQPSGGEPRRLHAKAVLLESDQWVSVLLGSSNFTASGLGLKPSSGHLELNLALGAPAGSPDAKTLRELIPAGDPIDPAVADWESVADDEEPAGPALPWGFTECLLEPGPPPLLFVRFDLPELPERWSVELPDGRVLADSAGWEAAGRPRELQVAVAEPQLPFWLQVRWEHKEAWERASWPVNVTDPSRLPPPAELRSLPVDALLAALASTRPLHEALATAIRRRARAVWAGGTLELDPLKRYASAGLFQRTRHASAALAGLRRRLERPAGSVEALVWRLIGPFGPRAIADGLILDTEQKQRLPGEVSFLLAELVLTLARVDWAQTASAGVPRTVVEEHARQTLDDLRRLLLEMDTGPDLLLARYVREACEATSQ